MCIGIPMWIEAVDGLIARATDGRTTEVIDLSLTGPQPVGTWVVTFLGAAREVVAADEAHRIAAAVEALRSVMGGGEVGDAFADIDAAGPRLPPHLQAALDAGRTTA